jgi:hypothetical protein
MPITRVGAQTYAIEAAKQRAAGRDEDFSSVIRALEEMTTA